MVDSLLPQSVSIVLVKTSHPGNVGSVARAMKTMGLHDLRLVAPQAPDIHRQPEAAALASGAGDLLDGLSVFESLAEALNDSSLAFALSARTRELGPALQNPTQAAAEAFAHARSGQKVAFVFGAERSGLTNDELLSCNRQVMIPANPVYSSLNLSQAVQIVSYALRLEFFGLSPAEPAVGVLNRNQDAGHDQPRATNQAVLQLQAHWLEAMEEVDFLNPDKPRKVAQRLAQLLGRAQLQPVEVDMLRGFLGDVIRVAQGRWYPHETQRLMDRLERASGEEHSGASRQK